MRALFRSRRALRRLPPATSHSKRRGAWKKQVSRCEGGRGVLRTGCYGSLVSRLNEPACFLAAEEARPPRFRAAALPRTPVAQVPCVATSTKQQQACSLQLAGSERTQSNGYADTVFAGGGTGGHTLGYSPAQVGASVQRADVQHYLDHLELDRLPCLANRLVHTAVQRSASARVVMGE